MLFIKSSIKPRKVITENGVFTDSGIYLKTFPKKKTMLTTSHILSSAFILYLLSLINPVAYPIITPLVLLSMVFANLPDLDGLWSKNLHKHHQSPLHAPLFWIIIFIAVWGITIATKSNLWMTLLFIIQITFHLTMDYVTARTCGVPLFYPFSKKEYGLCALHPALGKIHPLFPKKSELSAFLRYYVKNKRLLAVEVSLSLLGLGVLVL